MKTEDLMAAATDALTVRRVFAEPIERDGVTVITAAAMGGGGGGGQGQDEQGREGEGGGFGLGARPAGAYVIKDGKVRWIPAVDVNRLAIVVGAVTVACLLTLGRITRARAKAGAGRTARRRRRRSRN